MDPSIITDAALAAGVAAGGVIGSIYLITFARDGLSKWSRARELEAVNHAHTLSTLGDITGAGQAQTAIVADKGTTAVKS